MTVGEGEEHGLRPLATSGIDQDDITYGAQPAEPLAASGVSDAIGTDSVDQSLPCTLGDQNATLICLSLTGNSNSCLYRMGLL